MHLRSKYSYSKIFLLDVDCNTEIYNYQIINWKIYILPIFKFYFLKY